MKRILRLFTISVFLIMVAGISFAQTGMIFTPPESLNQNIDAPEPGNYNTAEFTFHLQNIQAELDTFHIIITKTDLPEVWGLQICTDLCYYIVDQQYTIDAILAPDSTLESHLDVLVMSEGDCLVNLTIQSQAIPEDSISLDLTVNREVGVIESVGNNQPAEFGLVGIYPNPFNSMSRVTFAVPRAQNATLTAYTVDGRKISTLFQGMTQAGLNHAVFRADKDMASGAFFFRLESNGHVDMMRGMYIK